MQIKVKIKENSFIARIAAGKLKANRVAIVIGNTIHLHNTSRENFMKDVQWVRHEIIHVLQFRTHGFISFIFKYLVESVKKGYYNNKYEAEARAGESDESVLDNIIFI